MMNAIGLIGIVANLGIIPIVLGLPWMVIIEKKNTYSFAYGVGFFIQLALYQLIILPFVFLRGSFIMTSVIYSIVIALTAIWSVIYTRKNGRIGKSEKIKRFSVFEIIYLIAFLIILGIQVTRGITYDITYMANDDGVYTVTAQQALEGQGLGNIHWTFGEAMPLNIHYSISGWLYYPAYLAFASGISVATIAHTIQYIQLIFLAYVVYWHISGVFFTKRESRLVFMLLISLFYWFGYHSHYSLTFRLLGPNYQGKAVLAVSLTPLVFSILARKMTEPFQWKVLIMLVLLSIASCCLTLWGAGTIIVIVSIPVVVSFLFKERDPRRLLYIPACAVYPVCCAGLYFLSKYAV